MKNSGIEWIGEIPDNQKTARLKQWIKIVNGYAFKSDSFQKEGDITVIRIGDIKSDIDFQNCVCYNQFNGQEQYLIRKNDILMAMSGATYGKIAYISNNIQGLKAINQRVGIIRGENNAFNKYIFQTKAFFDYLDWKFMGAAQPNISAGDILEFPVVYFDFENQKKISKVLDEKCGKIDKLIENEQKQIEKMKEYKQSVITSAVTKGLDKAAPMKDSGIDWIGEIPESWQLRKLNYCFDLIGSGTTPKSDNEEFYGEEIAWLQSGDINGGYVDKTEKMIVGKAIETYSALKIYQAPFLAVAMYGASVGNCSIVKLDAATNQACCVMSKSKGYLKYLFYCILAGKIALIDLAKGGTQPNISQEIIRNFRVPFPLTNEQKEIADYLDEKCGKIDEVISIKQRKIEKLQEYKKSLIYEYVTGKKEVV